MKKFYTVHEAKDVLECSYSTVYRLIKLGEVRAYQLGKNGQWRIDRESVQELMKFNERGANEWD